MLSNCWKRSKILSDNSIIHCDLKPENILVKLESKQEVKLIDFGSSCFYNKKVYTYIQSRFYRAPEIMLAIPYSCAIDMWSLGCILAELYTGLPLFPGESEPEQMALIIELLGKPPAELLSQAKRRDVFFDSGGRLLRQPPPRKSRRSRLEDVVRCEDRDFIDFIKKCLTLDPQLRMKPSEALSHKWIMKNFSPLFFLPAERNSVGNAKPIEGKSTDKNSKLESEQKVTTRWRIMSAARNDPLKKILGKANASVESQIGKFLMVLVNLNNSKKKKKKKKSTLR
eukprot:TRINITY_DN58477_c0_g1_i1.p1 TRINITY_DN58477_c0_g1~~TRINITY_DN58477_c0_g1_i1.p1  ORF type:complete len:283 (+),score=39.18 TRINITY_DN58477_c0_g1_i1:395-1243(+)